MKKVIKIAFIIFLFLFSLKQGIIQIVLMYFYCLCRLRHKREVGKIGGFYNEGTYEHPDG